MTDTEVATATPAVPVVAKTAIKKKPAASKVKKTPAAHPTTAVMVTAAIRELKEKKGSSLPAIKKYLSANYKVDSAKLAPFIRKFLKAAVSKGSLVQVNGNGAVGHFKLPVDTKKPVVKKVAATKKRPIATKKPTTTSSSTTGGSPKKRKLPAKKPKSTEPAAKKTKKAIATKPKVVKPKKSPAKAKKAPATKTKPPKIVKKTAAAPVKKTTPKKK